MCQKFLEEIDRCKILEFRHKNAKQMSKCKPTGTRFISMFLEHTDGRPGSSNARLSE